MYLKLNYLLLYTQIMNDVLIQCDNLGKIKDDHMNNRINDFDRKQGTEKQKDRRLAIFVCGDKTSTEKLTRER